MRTLIVAGCWLALVWGQVGRPRESEERRLPDGRSQTEAIAKAEFAKSLEDARELVRLAEALRAELEKNDRYVVSVASIQKTDQIEKLARRIRGRLKRR